MNSGRDKLSAELVAIGRGYLGLSVYQKMHILDWLKTAPFVEPAKIGLSGHSLGTEPAMVMAVLDPAVRALVFNDFLCNNLQRSVVTAPPRDGAWRRINPLWHVVPGFQSSFDFPDLLAAVAPRPLRLTEGGVTPELERMPEGLTEEEYVEYANADVPDHDIKGEIAVLWLKAVL